MPPFDPTEFVNHAISDVITVLGVLVGGLLAFRLGVRQVRRERAIDRRVAMYERPLAALQEFRSDLHVLARNLREVPRPDSEERKFRDYVLQQATEHGREFKRLLSGIDLYGTLEEQAHGQALFGLQIDLYMASWQAALVPDEPQKRERLSELSRLIQNLEAEEKALIRSLRRELDLDSGAYNQRRKRGVAQSDKPVSALSPGSSEGTVGDGAVENVMPHSSGDSVTYPINFTDRR